MLLFALLLLCHLAAFAANDKPIVVSTIPADGATNIPRDLSSITVVFDRSMANTFQVDGHMYFGGIDSPYLWSDDGRAFTYFGGNRLVSMEPLRTVTIDLNYFVDANGNVLDHYQFSFVIEDYEGGGLNFVCSANTTGTEPVVISTIPEIGATDVSMFIGEVVVAFDRPMDTNSEMWIYPNGSGFEGESLWSDDGTTFTYSFDWVTLPPLKTHTVTLNEHSDAFRDAEGNPLGPCGFKFSTASYPVHKVSANPGKGFHWPYYYYVPSQLNTPVVIFVEGNNTGMTDDFAYADKLTEDRIRGNASFAEEMASPFLMPSFLRPANLSHIYTQGLDRDTLVTEIEEYRRLDLQLLAMVDDLINRLELEGIVVERKVNIIGYSASGMFANRFTILHPDRVSIAAIGQTGGLPMTPIETYKGHPLEYPFGTYDYFELTGKPFDADAYRAIPILFYQGNYDVNDNWHPDAGGADKAEFVWDVFGRLPPDRWPIIKEIYDNFGGDVHIFHHYPGIGHQYSNEMIQNMKAFLRYPYLRADAGNGGIFTHTIILDADKSIDKMSQIVAYKWHLRHRYGSENDRELDGKKVTITDLHPGYYDVTLTVTNDKGNTDTDYTSLWVSEQSMKGDINDDEMIGLEEAIHALQVVAGANSQ